MRHCDFCAHRAVCATRLMVRSESIRQTLLTCTESRAEKNREPAAIFPILTVVAEHCVNWEASAGAAEEAA